jgi:hypothetical protein
VTLPTLLLSHEKGPKKKRLYLRVSPSFEFRDFQNFLLLLPASLQAASPLLLQQFEPQGRKQDQDRKQNKSNATQS